MEKHDIETGKYIFSVLKTRPDIVLSWGLDPESIKPIERGIQFHVQGFKHTGLVTVTLNEGADLFEVSLISESGETANTRESIFLDELISTIDELVENVENYEKRVSEEYPFLTQPDNPEKVRPMEIVIL